MLSHLFWHVGLVPLAAVALHGSRLPSAWWWLAAAFAVSWVADLAGWLGGFGLASQTYPLLQGALFALVLAPRPVAMAVIGGLAVASGLSLAVRGGQGVDVALHLAAMLTTAALARRNLAPGVLRWTLGAGCIVQAAAWCVVVARPLSVVALDAYGWVRVAVACGFAVAAWQSARARAA